MKPAEKNKHDDKKFLWSSHVWERLVSVLLSAADCVVVVLVIVVSEDGVGIVAGIQLGYGIPQHACVCPLDFRLASFIGLMINEQ